MKNNKMQRLFSKIIRLVLINRRKVRRMRLRKVRLTRISSIKVK